MGIFDRITLLLTGLVAIYMVFRFFQENKRLGKAPTHNLYYSISFAVLLVAGLLLIIMSYSVLANPLVVVVSYLIPFCLALGLVTEFYPNMSKPYLAFGLIGLIAIAVTRLLMDAGGWATLVLIIFHSTAGLLIFLIPIIVKVAGKVPPGFVFVTVGGTLIGIGGIALAFLKAGNPILSADLIFTILAPILLLMSLSFTWGFMKKITADKEK